MKRSCSNRAVPCSLKKSGAVCFFFRLRREEQFKDLRLIVKGAGPADLTVKVGTR